MGEQTTGRSRVVIVGAGFGGFQAAQSLAGDSRLDITLIDRHGRHVFTPLIYQVATGILKPDAVIAAPRSHLPPRVNVVAATVERVDFAKRQVVTQQGTLPYDFLILATGARSQIADIPGARRHALPLGTLEDAIAIHERLSAALTQAGPDHCPAIAIVGGGTTGAELAGSLAEWARSLGKPIAIRLIHGSDEILSEFIPRSGRAARRRLQRIGVDVMLRSRVQQVGDRTVTCSTSTGDTTELPADLVIWTAGVTAALPDFSAAIATGPKHKLRIRPTLQLDSPLHPLQHLEQVYAIGDVSTLDGPRSHPIDAVAPAALQQGVAVARNIRRQVRGQVPRPFRYLNKGRLAIVGGYLGVGKIAGISFAGAIAWAMWLGVHWVYLPGWKNRKTAAIAWWQIYCFRSRSRYLASSTGRSSQHSRHSSTL